MLGDGHNCFPVRSTVSLIIKRYASIDPPVHRPIHPSLCTMPRYSFTEAGSKVRHTQIGFTLSLSYSGQQASDPSQFTYKRAIAGQTRAAALDPPLP